MKNKYIKLIGLFVFASVLGPLNANSQVAEVRNAVSSDVSIPLREMKTIKKHFWEKWMRETEGKIPNKFRNVSSQSVTDNAVQALYNNNNKDISTVHLMSFDGLTNASNSVRCTPPDPAGDVSQTHYVQAVNCMLQMFNKEGVSVLGPIPTSTIWNGFTGNWSGHNDGDAIVLYDENASRWIISQFAIDCSGTPYTEYQMVAVSTTSDPTGSYYRYAFQFDYMPDYGKLGVWNDGYYMSMNRFNTNSGGTPFVGVGAAVMERNKMLTGDPAARMVYFKTETLGGSGSSAGNNCWSMLPSDCDGVFPATGTPNYFVYDDQASSELRIWALHADWTTPTNSTFTYTTKLTVSGFTELGSVAQQGTSVTLNGLGDRLMFRNQYRNFGSYESFVTCRSVSVSGNAGLRWYEYRKTGSAFSLYQQSTYAPNDGKSRWMGSIAMNASGDIGIAYSVSSSSMYPSIYFTGRKATDALNQLTIPEGIIHTGTVSMTGASRWGDYTAMNIDPSDNQTFWTTQEFVGSYGGWCPWATKIATFNFSPTIELDPSSLAFGNVQINTSSVIKQYAVTGTNLTANITVTAPAGYKVCTTSNGTYSSTIVLPQTAGVVNTTVYVKFNPTAVQSYSGVITNASTGAVTQNVSVSGAGVMATVVVSATNLNFGNIQINTSSTLTYTVSGSNLTANIYISATTPQFLLSLTGAAAEYYSTINVTPVNGTVNPTTIYVKFTPTAAQPYYCSVTNTSYYATTKTVQASGTGVRPTIVVNPLSLAFGNVQVNSFLKLPYNVTGSYLTSNIIITPPAGYQVCTTENGTFQNVISLIPTAGSVNTTIFVKFSPLAIQQYNGTITNTSVGAVTQNVAVTGSGVVPAIDVSPSGLAFGNVQIGQSSTLFYHIVGTNLTSNIIITSPAGYQVCTTENGTFSSTITITPSSGIVDAIIYVKFTPTAVQQYNGVITNSSIGATTLNVTVTGAGIRPTIVVTPTSLNFGNVQIGTPIGTPAILSYTVSGTNMLGDILITAPAAFQLCKTYAGTYTNTLTIAQSGGSVSPTIIYVKFSPTAVQTYSGVISNTSTGAITQNVSVTGVGVIPTIVVAPTSLAFGNVPIVLLGGGLAQMPKTYTVTGSFLVSSVTITAPTCYTVSTSSGGTYASSIILTPVSGSVNATIYVKFTPTALQAYNGNITNASSYATTANVAVTGTGIEPTCYCENNSTYITNSGTISDGSGSQRYTNNTDCNFLIQPTLKVTAIGIAFTQFQTEANYDFVDIYAGSNSASPLVAHYSGTSIPANVIITGKAAFIHFYSNSSNRYQGWTLNYASTGKSGEAGNEVIGETENEEAINLFPNPATNEFTLEMKNIEPQQISILDLLGKEVLSVNKQILNSSQMKISTAMLTNGLYIVRIRTASKTYDKRISIIK